MSPARFITDSSLDYLARRLRFLGFDVRTLEGARLEEVFSAARRDGRTVLKLSARHPRRFADVPAVRVARADPMGSVRALAQAHEPAGAPLSRCPSCNTPLERERSARASGHAPDEVIKSARALHRCPACGKWYWHGSHVERVRAWLERALGREVTIPTLDLDPEQRAE